MILNAVMCPNFGFQQCSIVYFHVVFWKKKKKRTKVDLSTKITAVKKVDDYDLSLFLVRWETAVITKISLTL